MPQLQVRVVRVHIDRAAGERFGQRLICAVPVLKAVGQREGQIGLRERAVAFVRAERGKRILRLVPAAGVDKRQRAQQLRIARRGFFQRFGGFGGLVEALEHHQRAHARRARFRPVGVVFEERVQLFQRVLGAVLLPQADARALEPHVVANSGGEHFVDYAHGAVKFTRSLVDFVFAVQPDEHVRPERVDLLVGGQRPVPLARGLIDGRAGIGAVEIAGNVERVENAQGGIGIAAEGKRVGVGDGVPRAAGRFIALRKEAEQILGAAVIRGRLDALNQHAHQNRLVVLQQGDERIQRALQHGGIFALRVLFQQQLEGGGNRIHVVRGELQRFLDGGDGFGGALRPGCGFQQLRRAPGGRLAAVQKRVERAVDLIAEAVGERVLVFLGQRAEGNEQEREQNRTQFLHSQSSHSCGA